MITEDLIFADVFVEYEKRLQNLNSLDLDDLVLYVVNLCKHQPSVSDWCKHVVVDEFQDTNPIQMDFLRHLGKHGRISVVGDPDQSSKLAS